MTGPSSTYSRGINMAGAEFSPAAATLPGTYSTDYAYDTAAAYLAIAARGHKIVRLPFRWERIQPTLNAALNSAELERLQQAVLDIKTAGMTAILDVHNFARFINSTANGGAELVLGDTLATASLIDLWTRLSTAFKNNTGVYAYDLMNEPHSLAPITGTFTGTTRYDWNDGTVQGWTGDVATATNVASRLRLAATATTGFFQFRKDDAGTKRGGTLTGNVLQADVTLATGTTGFWVALIQWQNTSFTYLTPTATTYTRVDTGAPVSGLIAGVAVRVRSDFSGNPISSPNAFAIQVQSNNATAGAVSVDVDDLRQGVVTGSGTAARRWEIAAQEVLDAIRANADTTRILIPGYQFSSAKNWAANHPAAWITDAANNHAYQAHYYFDVDNSGDYPDSYATENAAAVSAGHANLAARAVSELSTFTNWLGANGVKGILGEVGWPNTGDTASWNAVGEAIYDVLDTAGTDAIYWAGGARWGTTYNLSAYTGAAQNVQKSQAAIIEAHPTSSATPPVGGGGASTNEPSLNRITVDGQTLDRLLAQGVEGVSGIMLVPGKRGGNLTIPGAHGQLHVPNKFSDSSNLVLPLWVRGVNPDGSLPSGSDPATTTAFHERARAIVDMFSVDRVTIRHTLDDGTAREIVGEVTDVLDWTVRGAGRHTLGQVTVALNCADPFWRDLIDTSAGLTVGTGGTGVLGAFAGASAPLEDLVVTFGQSSNPRLTQPKTGVFVGVNRVIGAGQSVVVNTATWQVTTTGGLSSTGLYEALVYGGRGTTRWFALTPESGGPVVRLDHTGGGSRTVTVTGRRTYKIA